MDLYQMIKQVEDEMQVSPRKKKNSSWQDHSLTLETPAITIEPAKRKPFEDASYDGASDEEGNEEGEEEDGGCR